MADKAKRGSNLLQFIVIFTLVYFGSQLIINRFFPSDAEKNAREPGLYVTAEDKTVRSGGDVVLKIENTMAEAVTLPNRCPMPPVDVYKVEKTNEGAEVLRVLHVQPNKGVAVPCEPLITLPANHTETVTLAPWKYSLLGELGTYEARLAPKEPALLPANTNTGSITSTGGLATIDPLKEQTSVRFELYEPGVFTKLFRTFITKPFLNFLVFAASWLPGHNLGLAIILLTILVKFLLFYPTQKALQGQKEMQKLQPKLEALKKKHPKDPQKLQEETMKLWKEHNVNPMQSCLPTLIQFPVLIGLFYVIRDGTHLELSQHLLYPMYQNLPWTFGTNFLGLDLLQPDWFFLPPLLLVAQFLQMKLAFAINERNKPKQDVIDIPSVKELQQEIHDAPKDPVSAQKLQQQMLLYGLPIMIAVMAFQFPAAVSIYWGVSTLFGIGQQLVVNRKSL